MLCGMYTKSIQKQDRTYLWANQTITTSYLLKGVHFVTKKSKAKTVPQTSKLERILNVLYNSSQVIGSYKRFESSKCTFRA